MQRINRPASTAEAAAYAHVHRCTIHRWIRDGKLPAFRVGPRLLRLDLDDLDRLTKPVQPAQKAS